MCPKKESKRSEAKTFEVSKNLEGLEYILELDSCYRGRIERHRCVKTGEIIYQTIIR